jgi:hypothetical protein
LAGGSLQFAIKGSSKSKSKLLKGKMKKAKAAVASPSSPAAAASAVSSSDLTVPPVIPDGPTNKWLDLERKACLLCQRGFSTIEQLRKHEAQSKLHKKNLEVENLKIVMRQNAQKSESKLTAMRLDQKKRSFEDMVKESLQKEQEELSKSRVDKPIETSNKGNRMLQGMGWEAGQGLGRERKGITAPLQASIHAERAGLGRAGAKQGLESRDPGETYQTAARKRTRERFETAAAPGGSAGSIADDYLAMMSQYQSSSCGADDGHHRPMLK